MKRGRQRRARAKKAELLTVGLAPPRPITPKPGIRADRSFERPLAALPSGGEVLTDWDKRRAGHPPNFEDDVWSWAHVEFALRGALRVVRALPYQPGDMPAGFCCAWPDWLRDYPDAGAASRGPKPSGRQEDEAVAALEWLLTIQAERVRRGIVGYCAGLSWKRIREITGDKRSTYHLRLRVYGGEFRRIAGDLNRAKKTSPKDVAYVPFFGL